MLRAVLEVSWRMMQLGMVFQRYITCWIAVFLVDDVTGNGLPTLHNVLGPGLFVVGDNGDSDFSSLVLGMAQAQFGDLSEILGSLRDCRPQGPVESINRYAKSKASE